MICDSTWSGAKRVPIGGSQDQITGTRIRFRSGIRKRMVNGESDRGISTRAGYLELTPQCFSTRSCHYTRQFFVRNDQFTYKIVVPMDVTTVSLKMILLLLHSNEAWHTPFRPVEAHIAKTETKDRRWSGPLGCQECWTRMRLSPDLDLWLSIDDLDCELGEEYLVCSPCCFQVRKDVGRVEDSRE